MTERRPPERPALRLTHENAKHVLGDVRNGQITVVDMHVTWRGDAPVPSLPRDPEAQVKVLTRLLSHPDSDAVHLVIALA